MFAVAAVVAALLVGVPVGVLSHRSAEASAAVETPTSPPATPAVVEPPPAAPPASYDPVGLTGSQQALWAALPMPGVDDFGCHGYPEGEALDGVVASIECPIEDPSMSQPIIFHQFAGPTELAAYLQLRAGPIVRSGACSEGYETYGPWSTGNGPTRGTLVCVDNVKEGAVLFKMIWSDSAASTAAVIQEPSASVAWNWWYYNGGGQFTS